MGMDKKELGAAFSHRHLKYLNLDIEKALIQFKNLGLKWMRVCCYWDEIESVEGKYQFNEVDRIVVFCEKNNINVILSIGMKAPRYPEYYFPNWLKRKSNFLGVIKIKEKELLKSVQNFISQVIQHLKKYKSIKIWQVENEPLDPAGDKRLRISSEFLTQEISLVRKLNPSRKILVNVWGNELFGRENY